MWTACLNFVLIGSEKPPRSNYIVSNPRNHNKSHYTSHLELVPNLHSIIIVHFVPRYIVSLNVNKGVRLDLAKSTALTSFCLSGPPCTKEFMATTTRQEIRDITQDGGSDVKLSLIISHLVHQPFSRI